MRYAVRVTLYAEGDAVRCEGSGASDLQGYRIFPLTCDPFVE